MNFSNFKKKFLKFNRRSIYILVFLAVILLGGIAVLARGSGSFNIFASGTSSVNITVTNNGSRTSGATVTFANQSQATNSNGVATFSAFYDYPYPVYAVFAYYGTCSGHTSVTVNSSSESASISLNCQGPGVGTATPNPGATSTWGGATITPFPTNTAYVPYVPPGTTYSIHGVVKSSTGQLLQNADVSSGSSQGSRSAKTNDKGEFSVTGIPINTSNPRMDAHWVTTIKYPGYTPKRNISLYAYLHQTFVSAQDYDLGNIVLFQDTNSHIIHGKATDASGALVGGVSIVVKDDVPTGFQQHQWSGSSAGTMLATPANSNYEVGVNVRDDTYTIWPTKPGYVLDMNGDNLADISSYFSVGTTYSDPNLYIRKDFRMIPASTATGRTLEAKFKLQDKDTHAAVPGVAVRITDREGRVYSGTSTSTYQNDTNLTISNIKYFENSLSAYNINLTSSGEYKFRVWESGTGSHLSNTHTGMFESSQVTFSNGSIIGKYQTYFDLEKAGLATPTPAPSSTPPISGQCNLVDPEFPAEVQSLINELSSINANDFVNLEPELIASALDILEAKDPKLADDLVALLSRGSLNMNDVGSFIADYLDRKTDVPPQTLNLLRNIEQPNFGTYLSSHRKEVLDTIKLTRPSDPELANVLTAIVNDTTANGFNKNRTASRIASYLNNKFRLGPQAGKLLGEIQKVDFGKYVAKYPEEVATAIEYLREKDPETADKLEKLLSKSTIRLSDIINGIAGTRNQAIRNTQNNLVNLKISLNSSEYIRFQNANIRYNGVLPQSEVEAIFGDAIKRALLQAGSPLFKHEAGRLVAMLLQNPGSLETIISMLDHTTVGIDLVNQFIKDGTLTVNLSAQPVYLGGRVGGKLSLSGVLSTGKLITSVEASYNTCSRDDGEVTGDARGRITGSIRVTPQNGRWSGSVNVNATSASGEFNYTF